jgi:cold shock CspA family protein
MKRIVIAVASALLLAVAVTELSQRIWPDSRLALLLLCFLALLVGGLFNARQVQPAPAAATADRGPQPRKRDSNRARNNDRSPRPEPRGERGGRRDDRARKESRPSAAPAGRPAQRPATAPASGDRESGTVKWFNRSKGFGFVIRPNGEEIFVHQRSIRAEDGQARPALKDGETVSFVVAERERGLQAEDVLPERGNAS